MTELSASVMPIHRRLKLLTEQFMSDEFTKEPVRALHSVKKGATNRRLILSIGKSADKIDGCPFLSKKCLFARGKMNVLISMLVKIFNGFQNGSVIGH